MKTRDLNSLLQDLSNLRIKKIKNIKYIYKEVYLRYKKGIITKTEYIDELVTFVK